MTLRPSETEHGRQWLRNFRPEELHAAQLLINSLRIISPTAFNIHLSTVLEGLREELEHPIAVYPIRELPNEISAPVSHEDPESPQEQLPDGTHMPLLPLDKPFESLPGSEGIVGNIIRKVVGHRPDPTIISSPGQLHELRRARPRTILLVDDYSGTGNRIGQYVDSWMRHPTIRSWYSYKKINFHIALVVASGSALAKLEKHPRIANVHYHEQAADFQTAIWSEGELEEVQQLCIKYAWTPKFELGYQDARGLLVLHHTVPNNLPAILWQTHTKIKPGWAPFFPGRRMTPSLQEDLGEYRLEVGAADIANSMQQIRLGLALAEQPNPTVRLILLVLAAAARKNRDPRSLSVLLHVPLTSARETQQACQSLGFLDSEGRLTELGRTELRHARARADAVERPRLIGNPKPYYPTQLRESVTSSACRHR